MMPTRDGLRLQEHGPEDRAEVSAFIRDRFHRSYGATLTHLMPRLFSLRSDVGDMVAAFGLREALRERLFMECYLDRAVETVISLHHGALVPRSAIVEVGNLATAPGGARLVITALTHYLHAQGVEWITFTGVAALRSAFARLGLRPVVLAKADPARLSATELMSWGNYFSASPVVMGGYVPGGFQSLLREARPVAGVLVA
jgi:hypothetical protein